MGIISDITSGKTNIDTRVTPFDNIKEIFGKAFGSLCNNNQNGNEFFGIKSNGVELNSKPISELRGKDYLEAIYDPSKYLGDSRASQCNPSEHVIRNMSPFEFQTFLNGQTVEPISGIETSVLDRNGTNYCFSPETPVYLGDKLENTHQRMGREITPETIQNVMQERYSYIQPGESFEPRLSTTYFPPMENMQVVFQINDTDMLKNAIFPNCEGRDGIDPCFGGSYGYGDNTDCEIRLVNYNQDMLTPIAVEGINVEGMSSDEVANLVMDLMNARNDGISIDTFIEQNAEYEHRYDNSNIVPLDNYERPDEKYREEFERIQEEYKSEKIGEWDEWDE